MDKVKLKKALSKYYLEHTTLEEAADEIIGLFNGNSIGRELEASEIIKVSKSDNTYPYNYQYILKP